MLQLKAKGIIGIDLAGKPENPTGWASWENKKVKTTLLYMDNQILEAITQNKPDIMAVDALTQIGLEADLKVRTLTPHETGAVIAVLTAYLYMRNRTETLGDKEEGYIIIPKKQDWRTLQI
jgi:predicted nuclease with RNAse H fold